MSELIDTTEMYLRIVFELDEEGTPAMRARIAERLEQSGPTVSQTVARMERDGLLTVGGDRIIRLSPAGQERAARVMRKHRLAECMLIDVLNLDWDLVHAEACRWEHVMSDDVERRLLDVLGHPTSSPFGLPIPALDELDPDFVPPAVDPTEMTLIAAARQVGDAPGAGAVRISRIDETAQADPDLAAPQGGLLAVGSQVRCRLTGGDVAIDDGTRPALHLSAVAAGHIWVLPVPAEEPADATR